ncbi:MAG: alpha/beta hydrolase [Gemmatimonadales bacterium]
MLTVAGLTAFAGGAPASPAGRPLDPPPATRPVAIYLHGRIIEDEGPVAVSPVYGRYDFPAVVDSLRASGFDVIAELRQPGTDIDTFAAHVAAQVDSLLAAGHSPNAVAVVGFSKGGGIAIRAAHRLRRTDLTFVILAACGDGTAPDGVHVAGQILSVIEASDEIGRSCAAAFGEALPGTRTAEVTIHTGLRHGAFYQPRPEWLGPVRDWIGQRAK